jgi:hypothetical protein
MDLFVALLIYLIIVLLVTIFLYKLRRTLWSSLLCALIIGFLVLIFSKSPSDIDPHSTNTESNSAIYLLILFLTPVYVFIYAFVSAWKDKRACFKA